jgi:hypothetical protein
VPLVGGRLFWAYRAETSPAASDAGAEAFNAAFDALEAEFDSSGTGPIGLCLVVDDPADLERGPELVWPDTQLMLAGYLPDDRQVRIRYFEDAAIGPGLPTSPSLAQTRKIVYEPEAPHPIEPFGGSGATAEDVLELWRREGVVPEQEAQRRVHEVFLVALSPEEGVVGVTTVYLQRNPQLRMDLWYCRAFVGRRHRMSSLAGALAVRARERLEERFLGGEETRAPGAVYEVENEGLKRHFNRALWLPTDFTFIGENDRGDHVRVHYFAGAEVPG